MWGSGKRYKYSLREVADSEVQARGKWWMDVFIVSSHFYLSDVVLPRGSVQGLDLVWRVSWMYPRTIVQPQPLCPFSFRICSQITNFLAARETWVLRTKHHASWRKAVPWTLNACSIWGWSCGRCLYIIRTKGGYSKLNISNRVLWLVNQTQHTQLLLPVCAHRQCSAHPERERVRGADTAHWSPKPPPSVLPQAESFSLYGLVTDLPWAGLSPFLSYPPSLRKSHFQLLPSLNPQLCTRVPSALSNLGTLPSQPDHCSPHGASGLTPSTGAASSTPRLPSRMSSHHCLGTFYPYG